MVPDGAAASGDRQGLGEHVVPLRHPPGQDDGSDGCHREDPSTRGRYPEQRPQRRRAGDRGDHDERQAARGQPVEQVSGIGSQHEDAHDRHEPRDHRGEDRAASEVGHHLLVGQATRVPDEVDGGEIGSHDHGEGSTEDGRRVDPAVPRIAGLPACGDAARGDAAHHRPQAVGHEHGRDGEDGAELPPVAGADHGLVEREARASKHDAQRGDRQRHEQRERDRRVRLREAGPQHDEGEDEPDVVRLPDRGDRVIDHRARTSPPRRSSGDEIPEAGTEVGAAEQRVGDHPDEEDDRRCGAHGSSFPAVVTAVCRGP